MRRSININDSPKSKKSKAEFGAIRFGDAVPSAPTGSLNTNSSIPKLILNIYCKRVSKPIANAQNAKKFRRIFSNKLNCKNCDVRRDNPIKIKHIAAFAFIEGRVGIRLFRVSLSSIHPVNENKPINITQRANEIVKILSSFITSGRSCDWSYVTTFEGKLDSPALVIIVKPSSTDTIPD